MINFDKKIKKILGIKTTTRKKNNQMFNINKPINNFGFNIIKHRKLKQVPIEKAKFITLYHGTPRKNIPIIRKEGLKGGRYKEISLASAKERAAEYTDDGEDACFFDDSEPLLKVKVPRKKFEESKVVVYGQGYPLDEIKIKDLKPEQRKELYADFRSELGAEVLYKNKISPGQISLMEDKRLKKFKRQYTKRSLLTDEEQENLPKEKKPIFWDKNMSQRIPSKEEQALMFRETIR